MKDYKLYIDGEWIETGEWAEIEDKYTGEVFARIPIANETFVDKALEAAEKATSVVADMPIHKRAAILEEIAHKITERSEEIAEIIALEAGKSWKYAIGEATRARETFTFAADVARNLHGETVPMDASTAGEDRFGFWIREPVGVVAAITPFNFPLNLVAHKVAPAIAAGCPVVLKPAGTTPVTAAILAEIIDSTDLPKGAFNLVHGSGSKIGKQIVKDSRPAKISFTGSVEVGKWIKENSDLKRVTLELGNNSPVVIDENADIDLAVERCLMGSFANSGQVCISVQRIYVHENVWEEFKGKFVEGTEKLKVCHPLEKDGDVGPMISIPEVDRITDWVDNAVKGGAEVLAGNGRINQRVYSPTVLTNVQQSSNVSCDEVFAPVVHIERVASFEKGIQYAAETGYGLQAGVFTRDINRAFKAVKSINVGGVMINDVPTYRVYHMPYGGNKQSGLGREGVKFAVEEMTQVKMVVINL